MRVGKEVFIIKTQTIDTIIDALENYDEIDYHDKEYLVDGVLDILEDIYKVEEDFEGRYYQGCLYMVEKGTEIPKLFHTIEVGSALTEERYKLKVMAIKEVRQHENGNLTMELLVQKIRDK